jgi:hypothetical protein
MAMTGYWEPWSPGDLLAVDQEVPRPCSSYNKII